MSLKGIQVLKSFPQLVEPFWEVLETLVGQVSLAKVSHKEPALVPGPCLPLVPLFPAHQEPKMIMARCSHWCDVLPKCMGPRNQRLDPCNTMSQIKHSISRILFLLGLLSPWQESSYKSCPWLHIVSEKSSSLSLDNMSAVSLLQIPFIRLMRSPLFLLYSVFLLFCDEYSLWIDVRLETLQRERRG